VIKIIAFDLVGVLVTEKDIKLTKKECKLERMFGSNVNDSDYLMEARKIIKKDSIVMRRTEDLINKIYEIKDDNLFKKIKEKNNYLKIIIATNHVSFVRNFIGESFGVDYLYDVLISAEIHKVKPNINFYNHILNKYSLKSSELLFLDDNIDNIKIANQIGIKTIKVDKDTDLYKTISEWLEKNDK